MTGVIDLLTRLVAIDSVNPSLVEGGAGEGEIAAFVAGWARDAGLDATVLEGTPGRPSVIVRDGRGSGRTLLLCGHLDTVGGVRREPRLEGDRLYGRGAYDMKAGLAAALIACREAAAADVVVAAVADEEFASLGVQEALRDVRADAAIVTEPTHRRGDRRPQGVRVGGDHAARARRARLAAGRGRRRDRGRRAGAGPARASSTRALPAHPLLGPRLGPRVADRRRLGPRDVPGVVHAVDSSAARCPARPLSRPSSRRCSATRTAPTASCSSARRSRSTRRRRSSGSCCDAAGGAPTGGASYWTDAAFIAAAGIPTVLFGPGGDGAHADVEWVSLSDTEAVTRTLIAVRGGAVINRAYDPAAVPAPVLDALRVPPQPARLRADARARAAARRVRQGRVQPARAARVQGPRRVVGGRAGADRRRAHAGGRQRRQPRPRGRARRGAGAGCAAASSCPRARCRRAARRSPARAPRSSSSTARTRTRSRVRRRRARSRACSSSPTSATPARRAG